MNLRCGIFQYHGLRNLRTPGGLVGAASPPRHPLFRAGVAVEFAGALNGQGDGCPHGNFPVG